MFVVKIFNMETQEEFIEIARDHKELDDIVESMHNIYGDILQIEVSESEVYEVHEVKTKRYSEKPEALSLEELHNDSVEELPAWLSKDLTGRFNHGRKR